MTIPTRLALIGVSLGLVAALLAAVDRRWLLIGLGVNAFVFLAVWLQGRSLRRTEMHAARTWLRTPQVGLACPLRITLENRGARAVHVVAEQAWPGNVEVATGHESEAEIANDRGVWSVRLQPKQLATFTAKVTPRDRGRLELPTLTLDIRPAAAAAAFAARRLSAPPDQPAVVLPDLTGVRHYDRLRRSRAHHAAGLHRQRVVGLGREFDQMREYLPGDDFRDVNWKATARTGKPKTNLYQVERSRDVLLCVDGGRLMAQRVGDAGEDAAPKTALDHAVDAALLLTHAAHDQGDRVGLVTFRDRVDTVLRPGTTNGPSVLRTLAAFDARPVFPNYLALTETLRARQTHRGLVFLLTDLADPQLAADLVEAMPLLVSRHLVVVVSLRDTLFERVAAGPVSDRRDGLTQVFAARHLDHERKERTAQLRKAGVSVLEADAEHLTLDVLNHYLAVKARQLL